MQIHPTRLSGRVQPYSLRGTFRNLAAARTPLKALARHWQLRFGRLVRWFLVSVQGRMWDILWFAGWERRRLAKWLFSRIYGRAALEAPTLLPRTLPIIYINLDRRGDRKARVEQELARMDLVFVRFPAVDGRLLGLDGQNTLEASSLACAMSHRAVLRSEESHWAQATMVVEDDLVFVCSQEELRGLMEDFLLDDRVDVLCIANNTPGQPRPISKRLAISRHVSTTACYVVKERARHLLAQSFHESVELLLEGESVQRASIDQHWKKLQRNRLVFAVPRRRIAVQGRSYSDITGKVEDRGI